MLRCDRCDGNGRKRELCHVCKGRGACEETLDGVPGLNMGYLCHHCGNLRCPKCGGGGILPTPEYFKTKLTFQNPASV